MTQPVDESSLKGWSMANYEVKSTNPIYWWKIDEI
jgi:hypothetical protein